MNCFLMRRYNNVGTMVSDISLIAVGVRVSSCFNFSANLCRCHIWDWQQNTDDVREGLSVVRDPVRSCFVQKVQL